jgi:pyrimidine operon attenuation protein/uracil phosphoribosyltransferase
MESLLMNGDELSKTVHTLGDAIMAANPDLSSVVLVGILTAGFPVAQRLQHYIEKATGVSIPTGKLDIALYRDDLHRRGHFVTLKESDIPFNVDNKHLILIDDVLFTGRTIRAAFNALLDFGRPSRIELGVLFDRGHRQLPVFANYIGQTIPTQSSDHIAVHLLEIEGEDSVTLRGSGE